MELKQDAWNDYYEKYGSFNRTFMELKQEKSLQTLATKYVLIGPSWN